MGGGVKYIDHRTNQGIKFLKVRDIYKIKLTHEKDFV